MLLLTRRQWLAKLAKFKYCMLSMPYSKKSLLESIITLLLFYLPKGFLYVLPFVYLINSWFTVASIVVHNYRFINCCDRHLYYATIIVCIL